MDGDIAAKKKPSFVIYRDSEARDYGEHGLMKLDDLTPAIAEGLGQFANIPADAQGQSVRLLYGAPGFSLTKVWFKSGYPLPLHSHTSDCLYYIIAGSIRVGTEELGPGDGFFVGSDVPYTYTTGPEGVEVLEFRNTDHLNIRFMSRTKKFWEKAANTMRANQETWKAEPPPSKRKKSVPAE